MTKYEQLFWQLLNGEREIDVSKSASDGIQAVVKCAQDFINDATANRPWKPGSPAERQYREWISKAQAIVQKHSGETVFVPKGSGPSKDMLGEKRVPGVAFPVDTDQFGFKKAEPSRGDQDGNVRLK